MKEDPTHKTMKETDPSPHNRVNHHKLKHSHRSELVHSTYYSCRVLVLKTIFTANKKNKSMFHIHTKQLNSVIHFNNNNKKENEAWFIEKRIYCNFTTMQDMSSLLFLERASSIKCFAAACASFMFLMESAASWFDMTCENERFKNTIQSIYT